MSSSIRPPGTRPPGLSGLGGAGEVAPGSVPVKDAARTGAPSPSASGAAQSASAEWLRRLDAGEVTKQQAVEGLVAHALEAQGAARLSAAQRSELADVLRQTLLNDPVLGALLGE